MDILNDYYPLHPSNPNDYDSSEDCDYLDTLDGINDRKRKIKNISCDDFCLKYSDDLWYIWCTVVEYRESTYSTLFNRMDYASFCCMCYENSTQY